MVAWILVLQGRARDQLCVTDSVWQAMRQAALREKYQHDRDEMLERLSETNRARNVVIAILATIVIITVCIDLVAGHVMNTCNDFSKPVVEMLFKELTVLGCIALLVFMSVKTGFPEEISVQVAINCTHTDWRTSTRTESRGFRNGRAGDDV